MIQLFKRHIGDFSCSVSSLSIDMPKREENKTGSFFYLRPYPSMKVSDFNYDVINAMILHSFIVYLYYGRLG